jgi:hypothetical protein
MLDLEKLLEDFKTMFVESKCRCGEEGQKPHICPFQQDVNGNEEDFCNCCEDCQYNCAMDI